jgi:hypothetical protein
MGEARRRKLAGLPKFQKSHIKKPSGPPPRSPQEVEKELASNASFYGRIDAAIDFLHATSEDALRQQTRRNLQSGSRKSDLQCSTTTSQVAQSTSPA